jgi:Family of unknown function (DUF5330)
MGRFMFFLLRMTFWLGLVCVLLPSGAKTPDANIDATQAVTAASAAVHDMSGFCDRQPEACAAGSKVAVAIGHKAEAGARTLYEFITARLADKSAPAETTASTDRSLTGAIPITARGTLTEADMKPVWHAPVPLPPRRTAQTAKPSA